MKTEVEIRQTYLELYMSLGGNNLAATLVWPEFICTPEGDIKFSYFCPIDGQLCTVLVKRVQQSIRHRKKIKYFISYCKAGKVKTIVTHDLTRLQEAFLEVSKLKLKKNKNDLFSYYKQQDSSAG